MIKRKLTRYPAEFKESSERLAVDSKESVVQIAKNLGVHAVTLQGWITPLLFKTREEAKQKIFNYIEAYYNRVRIHSANDYLLPVEYEEIHKAA